ncbi:outer membrane protein OmpA-like peptidoglycan-associated protein [Pedobacter africanus]|uniref:OOP family OmpA-OmpF porin n=1 Tax=Pedobacter africanus TaxID=151894 RepID=A0ACC6L1M5_9SPHI|nr:OmpA family protein [Pedobacter africanus]MDR6785381.1 OOP family OmpA-OmpF porin [Pedobacter africanus]
MKHLRTTLLLAAIGLFTISTQSCKTKKAIAKPTPPVEKPAPPVEEKKPEPAPAPKPAPAPVEEKPNYNFDKVYFEFDSGVLKTESFAVLDKIAAEMKKDASVRFILNGHSSVEGSAEHNMSLSVDRANSVKSYLVNAGVNAANLSIKGFGATVPAASNDDEAGRIQNRRVEFKINP